jgi:hypothetical protein
MQTKHWHRITNEEDGLGVFRALWFIAKCGIALFASYYVTKFFIYLFFRAM